MKTLGYFNQYGGRCKECRQDFNANERAAALRHFEKDHHWECLHAGTETVRSYKGADHYTVDYYTVFQYGTL